MAEIFFFSDYELLCDNLISKQPNLLLLDQKQLFRVGPTRIHHLKKIAKSTTIRLVSFKDYSSIITFYKEADLQSPILLPDHQHILQNLIINTFAKEPEEVFFENLQEKIDIPELKNVLGSTKKINQIKKILYNVAPTNHPVLLLGESGTGKSHLAKIIHILSKRNSKKFFSVNMTTIPESLAEAELFGTEVGAYTNAVSRKGFFSCAEEGTLFLDEIGDLPINIQPKLLQVLENNKYCRIGSSKEYNCNVRFVFATNKNLKQRIEEKFFREDLYYRISTFPIEIPPLREHKDDIPFLVESFLQPYNKKLMDCGLQKLLQYHWPGNIRELKNCLVRACITAGDSDIKAKHISF